MNASTLLHIPYKASGCSNPENAHEVFCALSLSRERNLKHDRAGGGRREREVKAAGAKDANLN